MIEQAVQLLDVYVVPLGALGVFLAEIIEEAIAPIPSALVMTGTGFLLLKGSLLNFSSIMTLIFTIAIPAAAGLSLGSLGIYAVAYYGGKPVLLKIGKWIGLSWDDILVYQKKLEENKSGDLLLFTARVIPFIPSTAISAFYGLMRSNIKRYLLFSFWGSFIRAIILGVLGWQVGNLYIKYASLIGSIEHYIYVAIAISLIIFISYKRQALFH